MQIIEATEDDVPVIGELVAKSFGKLAAARWLVPDPQEWVRVSRHYFESGIRAAIANGIALTVPDRTAAAAAINHTAAPTSQVDKDAWLREFTGPHFDNFRRFEAAAAAAKPRTPHYYGAFLAVRDDRQNDGVASAVMEELHRRYDELGVAVYAEASSSRLEHDFFSRWGYTPLGPPVVLDGVELLRPILRAARNGTGPITG